MQSEHKINDTFATEFSNKLYFELIGGSTIKNAFFRAREEMKKKKEQCQTCCCGHEHKAWCKWKTVIDREIDGGLIYVRDG